MNDTCQRFRLGNLRSSSLAALCLLVPLAGAQAAPSSSAAPSAARQGAGESVRAQRREWLKTNGLTLGMNASGEAWVGAGESPVTREPGPGWAAARIAAFERAESDARAQFVEMTGVSVAAESFSRLFVDDGAFQELIDPTRPPRQGRLDEIRRKLAGLDGAELRQSLEVLGLDAADLATLGEVRQRKALEQEFLRKVTTRSAQQLRGLRIVQSFEGYQDQAFVACVVMSWSRKNAQLADVIRAGRGTIPSRAPGRPLAEWLPAEDSQLLHDWGVRVFIDPKGEPIVACFSQAAVELQPTDSPALRETKYRAALGRARIFAEGDLTFFVNSHTVVEQFASRGENYEQALTLFPDGFGDVADGPAKLTSVLDRAIKTRGQAVIQGGSVVREWRAKHPQTGATFCGVVYVWSPTRARLSYEFATGRSAPTEGEGKGGKGANKGKDYPVDF